MDRKTRKNQNSSIPRRTGDSPVFLSPRDSLAYCPMGQASGTSLSINGEGSLKKKYSKSIRKTYLKP